MPHPVLKRVATQSVQIFGEMITYSKFEGESFSTRAIFQESYTDFDANGVAVDERTPTVWIMQIAVGEVDTRDTLTIESVDYAISFVEKDGYGLIKLTLRIL